jgi:hypothetical protein
MDCFRRYNNPETLKILVFHFASYLFKVPPPVPILKGKGREFAAAIGRAATELPEARSERRAKWAIARLALATAACMPKGPKVAYALTDFLMNEAQLQLPEDDRSSAGEEFKAAIASNKVSEVKKVLRYWM